MSITIEKISRNVYADLGLADAQELLVKAKLASKIGDIIKGQSGTNILELSYRTFLFGAETHPGRHC